MKKSDLQTGMRGMTRGAGASIIIVIGKIPYTIGGIGLESLSSYTEDLLWDSSRGTLRKMDITKVFNKPLNNMWFFDPAIMGELLVQR